MGIYENIVKMEEIRRRYDEGDFLSAQKVLDTMDLKKIKNLNDLNLIAEVYVANKHYEEAADIYHKIYERVNTRKSLFKLVDISIRLNNISEAEDYLQLYQQRAPEDFYNYIFRYKIDKLKGESYEHLIGILVALKKVEYTEKWAYELAKLYYKAGMEEECIKECSDIELWFGEGSYVEKARILKSYYSGETNKDNFMEEIKRRAELVYQKEDSDHMEDSQKAKENIYNQDTVYYGDATYYQGTAEYQEGVYDQGAREYQEGAYGQGAWEYQEGVNNQEIREYQEGVYGQGAREYQEGVYDQGAREYQEGVNDQETPEYQEDVYDQDSSEYQETSEYENTLEEADKDQDPTEENQTGERYTYPKIVAQAPVLSEEVTELLKQELKNLMMNDAVFSNPGLMEEEATHDDEPKESKEVQMSQEEVEDDYVTWARELAKYGQSEDDKKLQQLVLKYRINVEEIFGDFLKADAVRLQLARLLEEILHNGSPRNILLITGAKGAGKSTLAKDMALFYYQTGLLKSSKLAKIKASKLNGINIMSKRETLKNCCMVIENASELKRKTIDQIKDLMVVMKGELMVVFEEETSKMDQLSEITSKLATNRIHIPQYIE